jgi:hypothetical protein
MDEYFLSETYSPISSTVASWSELLVYVEFCNFMSSVWEIFVLIADQLRSAQGWEEGFKDCKGCC